MVKKLRKKLLKKTNSITITRDKLLTHIAGNFLTENVTETYYNLSNPFQKLYIEKHLTEKYESMGAYEVNIEINYLTDTLVKLLEEQGIEIIDNRMMM